MTVELESFGTTRELNRLRVVDALRRAGTASRSDLARATGLSRTTVASLVAADPWHGVRGIINLLESAPEEPIAVRARNRFVRFAQAIKRTRPTAPSSTNAAGRTSLSSAAAHGVAVSRQFSYSANCAFSVCSTRRAIAPSSAFACARDAPER